MIIDLIVFDPLSNDFAMFGNILDVLILLFFLPPLKTKQIKKPKCFTLI